MDSWPKKKKNVFLLHEILLNFSPIYIGPTIRFIKYNTLGFNNTKNTSIKSIVGSAYLKLEPLIKVSLHGIGYDKFNLIYFKPT